MENNSNNFDNTSSCNPIVIQYSLIYGVLIGIILGMISLGYISNRIGRRNGSIITSFLMCLGSFFLVVLSILFTSSSSSDDDENDNDNDDAASSSGDDEDVVLLFHGIVLSLFIYIYNNWAQSPDHHQSLFEWTSVLITQPFAFEKIIVLQ